MTGEGETRVRGDAIVTTTAEFEPSLRQTLIELWLYRDVLWTLIARQTRVRYHDPIWAAGWAVLQPGLTAAMFIVFFRALSVGSSDGVPYPLFVATGLLPWTCFATAVMTGATSLQTDQHLVRKIYFPREIVPLAAVISSSVELCSSGAALMVVFAVYGFWPAATAIYVLPLFIVLLVFVTGLCLMLSAATARVRHLRFAVPAVLQTWLLGSPIAYPIDRVPEFLMPWYAAINPLAAVVDGCRRALLLADAPLAAVTVAAGVGSALFLLSGLVVFRWLEPAFADQL